MKRPAKSIMGKKLQAEADEQAWTRVVIRAAFLIVLAFGAAWWWREVPWPARPELASPGDPASDLALRQAAYLGWAGMVILIPAYYAFWSRNRSFEGWRTWLSHWTVGVWLLVLHLLWSAYAAFGWNVSAMVDSPRVAAFWPALAVIAWWIFDIWLAARQEEETRIATVQRVCLSLAVLALYAKAALWDGGTLAGTILGAALIAAAVISAQDAWKKRNAA